MSRRIEKVIEDEPLAVENSTPNVIVNNHIDHNKNRWSWKKRGVVAATAGAVALTAVLALAPRSSQEDAIVPKAKVVKIIPKEIDLRAAVYADIEAQVHRNGKGLTAWLIGHIPIVGHPIMDSLQMTSVFTGPDGHGGGLVETLVGAKTEGVVVKPNQQTGKEVVDIPAKDIVLITRAIDSQSEVGEDNGSIYGLGAAEWNALPFGEKHTLQQDQAQLDQATRITAENYMQESCDKDAYVGIVRAMTAAYRSIGAYDYQQEKAEGIKLKAFDPANITVSITGGSPDFPPAYPIAHDENYTFHQSMSVQCTVDPNALQLHGTSSNY